MKKYRIITVTKNFWKTENFINKVEIKVNELSNEGFEIINVSFGTNNWNVQSAFITVKREVKI
jgi:hypothetical protein